MRRELRVGLAAAHIVLAVAVLASLAVDPGLTIPLLVAAVVLVGVTTYLS